METKNSRLAALRVALAELLEGIGMRREDVFIANTIKCRPPGNRDPQPQEIDSCRPWLEEQVRLIEPRVIGTLGNFATKLLTGSPTQGKSGSPQAGQGGLSGPSPASRGT